VDTLHLERVEESGEVAPVAAHRVLERLRAIRLAESGHVGRDGPGEGADTTHQVDPVLAGSGVAVHEDDGFARRGGAGFAHERANAADAHRGLPDHGE